MFKTQPQFSTAIHMLSQKKKQKPKYNYMLRLEVIFISSTFIMNMYYSPNLVNS